MKKQHIGIATAIILAMSVGGWQDEAVASYNGPMSSYWFPDELKDWSPLTDADAIYNRSHVPLAKERIADRINPHAQGEAELVALSALNQNTSGVPSQGGDQFYENTFSYWGYTDLMVYWAGSAGEGIIVPPSADVIDASHRNGVPIVGNVFFPPTVYGGQLEWLEQMLERSEDGSFPMADKLIEVADYYGFDGWFINQETEGANEQMAEEMQAFLAYIQEVKPETMHVMWYDSMIDTGAISWQNHLTSRNQMYLQKGDTRVSDSMFLNFWWQDQLRSKMLAQDIGRSPYDLYAGIDVEARGTATTVQWDGVFPEGTTANTSLGIYRPDWAFRSSDEMNEFYQKEQDFWVGFSGNPEQTNEEENWPGMAHYFQAKSPITDMPFVSYFNTGSGEQYSVAGELKSDKSWNNRSLQDVLPTWQWILRGNHSLDVGFNWHEAYEGGSSLNVEGQLPVGERAQLELYESEIDVTEKTLARWMVKNTGDVITRFGIRFAGDENYQYVEGRSKAYQEGWQTLELSLKEHKGKTITGLALEFESRSEREVDLYIGGMAIAEFEDSIIEMPQVKVRTFKPDREAVSLQWKTQANVHHYRVYQETVDGEQFLGATTGDIIYLDQIEYELSGGKESATLFVEAVSEEYKRSNMRRVDIQRGSF